jgi:hypothetical protein
MFPKWYRELRQRKAAAVSAENFESIGGQNFETSAT